jgi:hypothetical protein
MTPRSRADYGDDRLAAADCQPIALLLFCARYYLGRRQVEYRDNVNGHARLIGLAVEAPAGLGALVTSRIGVRRHERPGIPPNQRFGEERHDYSKPS